MTTTPPQLRRAVLPEIENIKDTPNIPIDLQQELNSESVTQPNTELLEELSEFSNLLNLDEDELNSDLPLVGNPCRDPDQPNDGCGNGPRNSNGKC